jgi:hypothetical protein
MAKCKTKTKGWGVVNPKKICRYKASVDKGGHLSNSVNNDVNLFKVGVSDMPFQMRLHIKTAHGGAPW